MLRKNTDPFWDLVATARRLQAPGGCAWDRAQNVESLIPHLIEETWEAFVAVRSRRRKELQQELGDCLYTVLFLTLIAERRGWFSLDSLLTNTHEKMLRRHPHVFGDKPASTPGAAYERWRAVKRQERNSPSRSKALRPLLVECWELVRQEPDAAKKLRQVLKNLRTKRSKVSGQSRKPSAKPRRARAR